MPPKSSNRNIRDFFKPFTIPKNRVPVNDTIEDEIIVASPSKRPAVGDRINTSVSASTPTKRPPGRPRKDSPRSSNAATPTKRSPTKRSPTKTPKKSPTKTFRLPQLDDDTDDPLVHISPASSQQRSMTAVEIPAPRPPPPQPKREMGDKAATTSFSSISTLSSMPQSSQSSSKRILKNGMQAVTNSDSGSADSDSSDELADISSFVPRKKRKITPPPALGRDANHAIEIPSTVKPSRRSGRISDEDRKRATPKMIPSPPRTVYKHSLANMIKQQKKHEKSEARIQEAEAAFEAARKRREEELQRAGGPSAGLQAATADDSDEGERMKLAIARTEAMQGEQQLFYFRGIKEPVRSAFPGESGTIWERYRNNDKAREQAFLSGFVAQLADANKLPDDIAGWIIEQLPHEPRQDLCEAYVEVLRVLSTSKSLDQRVSPRLTTFHELAHLEASHTSNTSMPKMDPEPASTPLPDTGTLPGLRHVLHALRYVHARRHDHCAPVAAVLSELIPALIDVRVTKDTSLCEDVADTVECIVEAFSDKPSFEILCKRVHKACAEQTQLSPLLHCRAIAAMPARSKQSHHLRRMLALHHVTDKRSPEAYTLDLSSPQWVDIILSRLKTAPEFAISESSDYALLSALISVLDIAIDAGFSDFSFRQHRTRTSKPINTFAKTSPWAKAEAEFNAQVDALVAKLRSISSRIRDAGTTHLRRTEAKGAIDWLVLRLEFCVRTKPKPKGGVFGGGMGGQREFLSRFLKHAGGGEDNDATVVPVEQLGDGKVDDSNDENAGAGAQSDGPG
ncbi:uncharacterized protein LTR77_000239 [Saxophila tyrrhenica]|uniref:Uncharacterized protein n=1 Tax=Saxophila tyrrhenica TaxID=1690608 RepID=A0AAV9PQ92_9PEZI|nr:hypothetical protein LTR77_000239 [Saxophila tyrrhenica]